MMLSRMKHMHRACNLTESQISLARYRYKADRTAEEQLAHCGLEMVSKILSNAGFTVHSGYGFLGRHILEADKRLSSTMTKTSIGIAFYKWQRMGRQLPVVADQTLDDVVGDIRRLRRLHEPIRNQYDKTDKISLAVKLRSTQLFWHTPVHML
jgi:hypothetical protein